MLAICALAFAGAAAAPAQARKGKAASARKKAVFEACRHGCRYRTIQKAVDAAGAFEFKHPKRRVVVAIRPGKYVEGVVVDGTRRHRDFEGLTIEGTKGNPKKAILEGNHAKSELGPAQNGIEAIGVTGLVLRNMWARNYRSNGFFVHSSGAGGRHCAGYTMDNLVASGNHSYGLSAGRCLGGRMVNSTGYRQGAAAFHVGETPCEERGGTNPCQKHPGWALLKNDRGYQNALGYSGTNSKYVKVVESAFYDNGAGIVLSTLDGGAFEPNGWNLIERNDVFWNNYNYFLATAAVRTVSVLGELGGQTVNYPTGVGILLYGGDGNIVRRNKAFGNYKWGIASFSGPSEAFVLNEDDEAKNINNQITENTMGREGADPNGEYDFWNDDTGGGNCWEGNNRIATFAPGNRTVPLSAIYPACPQPQVSSDAVKSLNTTAGLQVIPTETRNPKTILGYVSTSPPQNQQCSWVRRVATHPPFQTYEPVEVPAAPGELTCG